MRPRARWRRWPQDRADRPEGRPDQTRRYCHGAAAHDGGQGALGHWHVVVGRSARDAAGRAGRAEEDPDRREPAAADQITRRQAEPLHIPHRAQFLAGRDLNALAIGKKATRRSPHWRRDYAFGRDGVAAFKEALARPARLVAEEYAPLATDFTAVGQRLFDALKDKPGRKIIWVIWAGGQSARQAEGHGPKRHGIELSTGGNILPRWRPGKDFLGMEGAAYYFYSIPKNPIHDWLVAEHEKRFNAPP